MMVSYLRSDCDTVYTMHNSIEKRLGEIALRVNDIETMATFYETVIQLPLLRNDPTMAFLRVSEGYQGHTSILALFKRDADVVQSKTSLDHIAFSIDLKDFEPQKKRLKDL